MARLNPLVPHNDPNTPCTTSPSAEASYDDHYSKLRLHLKTGAIQNGVLSTLIPTYNAAHNLARADIFLFKSKSVQDKIWRAITKCNIDFRARLNSLDKQKCPVKTRQLKKSYLGFLIQAQAFFVELVCIMAGSARLAVDVREKVLVDRHFRGRLSELDLPLESDPAERLPAKESDPELAKACYDAFVCLGDLSRYREQFRDGARRVESALEWLDLAIEVMPEHGRAWYQRGVLFIDSTDTGERLQAIHGMYKTASVRDGLAGAAKSLSSFLASLRWREEVPVGSSMHRMLRFNEPEWKAWVLTGSLLNTPFSKDGFVLDNEGVKSMIT